MSAFLSESERVELTGYKRPSAQRAWLDRAGVPIAWICADGLRRLQDEGDAIVYQKRQEFVLTAEQEQTPLYAVAQDQVAIAVRALKLIEHATAPGNDDAHHENAYTLARQALSDIKWGTVDGAPRQAERGEGGRDFERWWNASKYCQVVIPQSGWEQIARDAWNAALAGKGTK